MNTSRGANARKRFKSLATRAAGILLWNTVDRAVSAAASTPAAGGRTRVLVVRLDDIGDYILWSRAAVRLREIFPPASHAITAVVNRPCAGLAESAGAFDEVWPVDYVRFVKRPGYRYEVLQRVRRAGFDVAVNPAHSRTPGGRGGPLWGDAVVRASRARDRVGVASATGSAGSMRTADRTYTRLIPHPPGPQHELELHAAFLRALGLADARPEAAELPESSVRDGLLPHGDFYTLFPGTKPFKRWPVENFAEVARRIHTETGWTGVVCGGPGEEGLGRSLAEGSGVPVVDLVGRTSIPALVGVIKRSRLLVSNDSSAIHIAASVGTRSVCVLGGGHYGRFLPYPGSLPAHVAPPLPVIHEMDCFGCGWECIHPPEHGGLVRCVSRVSVEDVWEDVRGLIRAATAGDRSPATSTIIPPRFSEEPQR